MEFVCLMAESIPSCVNDQSIGFFTSVLSRQGRLPGLSQWAWMKEMWVQS